MTSPIEQAEELLRTKTEKMTDQEFNLGLAILMKYDVRTQNDEIQVFKDNNWIAYDPMKNWEQFGEVISNQPISTHSQEIQDDNDKVIGFRHSCNAGFSSTSCEGNNYQKVVAQTCIKLLEHNIRYHPEDYSEPAKPKNKKKM